MHSLKDVINYEINQGKKRSLIKTIGILLIDPSKNAIFRYRIAKKIYDKGFKTIAIVLRNKLIIRYGLHISLQAEIDLGLELRHINGVVIGDGVKIGKNVIIYQQVTLGGQNLGDGIKNNYPKIEDDVTIFAGAKILGNLTVGRKSIIGANSLVINNVDAYSVYAGIPAKKIKDIKEISE